MGKTSRTRLSQASPEAWPAVARYKQARRGASAGLVHGVGRGGLPAGLYASGGYVLAEILDNVPMTIVPALAPL